MKTSMPVLDRIAPGVARIRLVRSNDLMKLSALALRQCKASVRLSGDVGLRSARRFGVEGMRAFLERRPPAFHPGER